MVWIRTTRQYRTKGVEFLGCIITLNTKRLTLKRLHVISDFKNLRITKEMQSVGFSKNSEWSQLDNIELIDVKQSRINKSSIKNNLNYRSIRVPSKKFIVSNIEKESEKHMLSSFLYHKARFINLHIYCVG